MDIYVKAKKKVTICNRTSIKIKDIAEIFAPGEICSKIEATPIRHINDDKPQNILLSIIDIIKLIDRNFPGNNISSVGETDVLVHFEKIQKPVNKAWQIAKIAFICLILAAGSSTAIMSFHTDAQIPIIFKNYYHIFFNETTTNLSIVDIPYSIGLAVGIIAFFDHFSKKKDYEDPTPIDVEMCVYEGDVIKTVADKLSASENVIGKK